MAISISARAPALTMIWYAEMPLGETGLVGKCVPLDGGYLPFVKWNGGGRPGGHRPVAYPCSSLMSAQMA